MASPSQRLDGWKGIAGYLGRDERTAQRWRQRGLPVHLVPGGKRGTVFALTQEIDDWLTRHGPSDDAAHAEDNNGQVHAESNAAPASSVVEPPSAAHSPSSTQRTLALRAGFVATVLLAVVLGSVGAWRFGEHPRVVKALMTTEGLVAWTAGGQVAFAVPLTDLLPLDAGSAIPNVVEGQEPVVHDLDRDGSPEILAVVSYLSGPRIASDEVFCYSETGALRWRYRLQQRLRFGGRDYDGPWRVTHRLVTQDADGQSRIFLAVVHEVWWPAFVVALDPDGKDHLHHVNSGHIWGVERLQSSGRDTLLVTGVNNEYKSAFLAAIELGAAVTASPQRDPAFSCQRCASAVPATYVLFPPTELGLIESRPYNMGISVVATTSEVQVSTQELNTPQARAHYRLSRALELQSFGMSDTYWVAHREFEHDGKLDHPLDLCPEQKARLVRAWTPDGWREISVPNQSAPD